MGWTQKHLPHGPATGVPAIGRIRHTARARKSPRPLFALFARLCGDALLPAVGAKAQKSRATCWGRPAKVQLKIRAISYLSMVQMETRFHSGSENISEIPLPAASMRLALTPYFLTSISLTAAARLLASLMFSCSGPSLEA